jgi:two-component system NarL family sensor kinase
MMGSLAAIAVVVVGGFFALRQVTTDEAVSNTRDRVRDNGQLVAFAGLQDGILRLEPAAERRLDDVVRRNVRIGAIVRVKLWSKDGRILYSDEPALIGRRFGLGPEELGLFATGGTDAGVSDLSDPENRYERAHHKLLEAHTVIRTPNGTPVLFEIYERFGAVTASGHRLLRALAPSLIGGVLALLVFQLPLAWSMARRLQRGHGEREALLENAVEASSRERGRIAADLHDGVVQDLAGLAFGLAPVAANADRRGDRAAARTLRDAMERLRQGTRDLRALLVGIDPPSVESAGLEVALSDLLSPLAAKDIKTEMHVDARPAGSSAATDTLIYRVAREAIRNAVQHAAPTSVRVEVGRPSPRTTRLVVTDDGRGFDRAGTRSRAAQADVGLGLLEDLALQSGARLDIDSAPGHGTTLTLEVSTPPERRRRA